MSNVQILTLTSKKIEFLLEKNSSTHRVQKILVQIYLKVESKFIVRFKSNLDIKNKIQIDLSFSRSGSNPDLLDSKLQRSESYKKNLEPVEDPVSSLVTTTLSFSLVVLCFSKMKLPYFLSKKSDHYTLGPCTIHYTSKFFIECTSICIYFMMPF